MNRNSILLVMIVAGLMAGCGDQSASAGSTPDTRPAETSASETQQREVTFSIPDMSCPMCPITVRKALARIDGVSTAEASLDDKQARVVFDPTKTNIDALVAAVAEAGFSATAIGHANE